MQKKRGGEGGSVTQKRASAPLPDAVVAKKKISTPSTSDKSTNPTSKKEVGKRKGAEELVVIWADSVA